MMNNKISTQNELKHIIVNDGLYKKIPLKEFINYGFLSLVFDTDFLNDFLYTLLPRDSNFCFIDAINIYCPNCNEITTHDTLKVQVNQAITEFKLSCLQDQLHQVIVHCSPSEVEYSIHKFYNNLEEVGPIERKFACAHCAREKDKHIFSVFFKVHNHSIMKVGQYPSVNDLTGLDLKKYKKIDNDIFLELNKANGLFSHGIGVGSYVYLRRIIEKHIVNEKFKNHLEQQGKNTEDITVLLKNTYFQDKVKLLKDELSDLLHGNDKIYGFLSKGIHGLSEDECKEYYPILFDSICVILDDELERIEKEKKRKELAAKLNQLK